MWRVRMQPETEGGQGGQGGQAAVVGCHVLRQLFGARTTRPISSIAGMRGIRRCSANGNT